MYSHAYYKRPYNYYSYENDDSCMHDVYLYTYTHVM